MLPSRAIVARSLVSRSSGSALRGTSGLPSARSTMRRRTPHRRRRGEDRVHEVGRLVFRHPVETQAVDMIEGRPSRHEFWPRRRDQQDAFGRDPFGDAVQELDTRGVAPVQVLDKQHDRFAFAQRDQPVDQPIDRSLSARLGTQSRQHTPARMRETQKRGHEGQRFFTPSDPRPAVPARRAELRSPGRSPGSNPRDIPTNSMTG